MKTWIVMTGMSMDMANLNLTVSLWYTVDGYSGKVLWLKVCRTNNDPAITGHAAIPKCSAKV